jgi:hypothetical protein
MPKPLPLHWLSRLGTKGAVLCMLVPSLLSTAGHTHGSMHHPQPSTPGGTAVVHQCSVLGHRHVLAPSCACLRLIAKSEHAGSNDAKIAARDTINAGHPSHKQVPASMHAHQTLHHVSVIGLHHLTVIDNHTKPAWNRPAYCHIAHRTRAGKHPALREKPTE